jgi:tungstate transport system permease protein
MDFFWDGVGRGFELLAEGDAETWFAIGLSLWTSVVALAIGAAVGVPLGAWIGLFRPRGARAMAFVLRVGIALPTVFVGTVLYGLLSWRGPLSGLGLLYTPWAIVIGQALLAVPILATFAHAATAHLDPRALETVRTHGGSRRLALSLTLSQVRTTIVSAALLAFGRCITELGVALAVGGSIRFQTRTLPALATLEVSRGEFARSIACGMILVWLACGAAAVAYVAEGRKERG